MAASLATTTMVTSKGETVIVNVCDVDRLSKEKGWKEVGAVEKPKAPEKKVAGKAAATGSVSGEKTSKE